LLTLICVNATYIKCVWRLFMEHFDCTEGKVTCHRSEV